MIKTVAFLKTSPNNFKSLGFICTRGLTTTRNTNNVTPQTVDLQNQVEEPVIAVSEHDIVDIIGPPDPVSNLRPIVRKRILHETDLQTQLREMQNATQLWNHEFWVNHNTNFIRKRDEYIKQQKATGKLQLTADEMSDFYKKFLDENWEYHVKYNFEWYRKNFRLLVLAFRVLVERNFPRLKI